MVDAGRPALTRMARTLLARRRPSAMFCFGPPIVSVWPMTTTSGNASALTAFRISGTSALESFVSFSAENWKYRMKCFGAGGRAASASANSRSTSAALSVLTAPGGASAVTRVDERGSDSAADPNSLEALARPVLPASGSGSSTIVVGGAGREGGGAAARLRAQRAVKARAAATTSADLRIDADGNGRTSHADDRGRRLEADRVGSELRDAARHVRRHAADEVQDHPEA